MRILITNDDGFDSNGIRALVEELSSENELIIAAPAQQQSAKGHSVTLFSDLEGEQRDYPGTEAAWAIWGTPADCTYLGVNCIMKDHKPDLVIAGINHGSNVSLDNIYSGTLGAATEGMIMGFPSIAVSLNKFRHAAIEDFRPSARIVRQVMDRYVNDPDCRSYTLSINVPEGSMKDIKGMKITGFDPRRSYARDITMTAGSNGRMVFHSVSFECEVNPGEQMERGDIGALEQGFVSLTPIGIDWVDHKKARQLLPWELSLLKD